MYVIKCITHNNTPAYFVGGYMFSNVLTHAYKFNSYNNAEIILNVLKDVGHRNNQLEIIPYDSIIGTYISINNKQHIITRFIKFLKKLIMWISCYDIAAYFFYIYTLIYIITIP